MAVDVIKFVDSIAASPTTRLDVNDGTVWRCGKFDAPPPQLRRAMSSNAMRDGIWVSSSQYDARTLTLELALVHSSEDNAATEWQKLARELDRENNYLMYQPTGATKPVFFRLYRSDVPAFDQFTGGAQAFKKPTVRLLAEPFALGLRETIGPVTVNNDPAAASNQHFFDVTGVIGDVAAPCVLVNTDASIRGTLAVRQHGTPSDMTFYALQAESASSLITDTTNPGGGPDAAMSGAGTNNFVRTSFATVATMTDRISHAFNPTDPAGRAAYGRYRLAAVVRRSDATSVMRIQGGMAASGGGIVYASPVTVPQTTSRQFVDLGVVFATPPVQRVGRHNSVEIPIGLLNIYLKAARDSGAGTLDWDYFLLLPADECSLTWSVSGAGGDELVIDSVVESVYRTENAVDPFASTSSITGTTNGASGSFPSLVPNQTNRFFCINLQTNLVIAKTDTFAWTVHYWPQYMFVRPSAT